MIVEACVRRGSNGKRHCPVDVRNIRPTGRNHHTGAEQGLSTIVVTMQTFHDGALLPGRPRRSRAGWSVKRLVSDSRVPAADVNESW